ncbi:ABC transporter permease [Halorussus salinus]|uniref:ABC transporter permease n=1 Tax=Halorussus salinus TaxID=1364935 RepID=UPI0010925743|nr:ABC transporter permease [Halorussus salinus]
MPDTPNAATRASSAGRLRRLRVGVSSHVRAFVRTPLNVALLVAFPLVVVEGYGTAMSAFPQFPRFDAASVAAMGRVNGAVYASAFLAGILGLFQSIGAVQADERLGICGYDRGELFASRLAAVGLGGLLVAAVSIGVLWWSVELAAPLAAFGALTLAALIYGLIGMLVGALLPRTLEGSLVLVFLVDLDDFLSSGLLNVDSPVVHLLPLYYPHDVFQSAVFDGTVATGDALLGTAYLGVVFLLALAVYVRVTGEGSAGRGGSSDGGVSA